MRFRYRSLLFFFFLVLPGLVQGQNHLEKPFDRALVLSASGFSSPVALGAIAALEERGWVPDIVFVTQDTAMAGALFHEFDDPSERLAFMRSFELWSHLNSREISRSTRPSLADRLRWATGPASWLASRIPSVFENFSYDTPADFLPPRFDRPFETRRSRIVIVGAEVLFAPDEQGERSGKRKLFRETLFTDPETAGFLEGLASPAARAQPSSRVHPEIRVVSDANLLRAAHISQSDPFDFRPIQHRGRYYISGAVDPYPIELAGAVAREVVATYSAQPGGDEQVALARTYGVNISARHRQAHSARHVLWLDFSDLPEIYQGQGLESESGLERRNANRRRPAVLGVHRSLSRFQETVDLLHSIGQIRAHEALRNPPGNRDHLRNRVRRLRPLPSCEAELK